MQRKALGLVLLILATVGFLAGPSAAHAAPVAIEVSPQLPTSEDSLIISIRLLGETASFGAPSIVGNEILLNGTSGEGALGARFSLTPLPVGDYTVRVVIDGIQAAARTLRVSPPSGQLNLAENRFAVFVSWFDSQGVHRGAQAVQLSDNSGYFWFFGSDNVEVTIKILDGRSLNGHFWVFIGSMTTVKFTASIFEAPCLSLPIPCRALAIYNSPSGRNRNFIDLGTL